MSTRLALLSTLIVAGLLAGCVTSAPRATLPANATDMSRYVVVTLRNPAGPAIPRAGSTLRNYDTAAGYALAPATRANSKAVADAHALRMVSAWPIGLLGVHCIVYEMPPEADRDELIERLRRDRRIESAQPLQAFSMLGASVDDPYRNLQRNLDVMDVRHAHEWSRGAGVRIAVVDTGVDTRHPDLSGRIVQATNFVDDGRGEKADRHGTAVAGIIAAVAGNREGIIGIAPAAELYALRACWPADRDQAHSVCSTFTLAKAITAAIEARTQIVNLSLTGPADPLLTRLVEVGLQRGMIFVGAVAPQRAAMSFPLDIAGVIAVDASGTARTADALLYAPGTEVLTLVPQGRYDFLSGSSLAAASVSGGIALLLARSRHLNPEQVRTALARSMRSVDTDAGPTTSINLCDALAAVDGGSCRQGLSPR